MAGPPVTGPVSRTDNSEAQNLGRFRSIPPSDFSEGYGYFSTIL